MIALHKQARTTPAVRAEISASDEPVSVLAQRYHITESTVRQWQARADFNDRSHTPHRLQTTLTPAQEAVVVVELRRLLLLPLDDLVAVVKEFIEPEASHSAIHRCLRRHRVNKLRALCPEARQAAHKPLQAYEPGFVHIDMKYPPQMPDETARRYLFVAIDRATRWVFVQNKPHKTARSAAAFLKALSKTRPIKIHKILTDNGKEFTDRLFGRAARSESGRHEFDQLCQALGIEHRLTRPRRPQTNDMVERFNGRIEEVLRSPPCQNSCRLFTMTNLGAKRMEDGTIRRSVQETGGGAHVAAGERRAWRVVERSWRFGADVGEQGRLVSRTRRIPGRTGAM
ncbi:DDE-type integrase/transposase/recombinase, partial [Tepidimonas sp.]|uniref:DDE-type integrase/transposase/recombinase n=1 Tax=Tepidimonas sp. TaxID=2002775 RepID=UPI0028CFA1B4